MTDLRQRIADDLARARRRSESLTVGVLDDAELTAQHSPIMSPLVWDFAHVGNQEELWLVRDAGAREPVRADIDELYDAFKHPRKDRPALPLLDPRQSAAYIREVREKALDVLEEVPMEGRRLTEGGFVFGMIVQHEQQHVETMLATHQLRAGAAVLDAPPAPPSTVDPSALPATVLVPAGPFEMGTSIEPWALDNERPAHPVDVPAFRIDTFPVSNADYAAFVEAGGYDDPRWWTAEGWDHRQRAGLAAPAGWTRDGDRWWRRRFGRDEPVPANEPVQHVTWFEADAYARWSGARLPTEAEWEKAARTKGGLERIGDVWEWTATDFDGYPGFKAFPYREYSEVFFGPDYKVLRGSSWATHPWVARTSFRNWDYPIRRQIFAGFRCARDC